MSDQLDLYKPTIPAKVRTVVYIVGLTVGVLAILATGLAAIWLPAVAAQVAATAGTFSSAAAFLAGALGVVYRPTAQVHDPRP